MLIDSIIKNIEDYIHDHTDGIPSVEVDLNRLKLRVASKLALRSSVSLLKEIKDMINIWRDEDNPTLVYTNIGMVTRSIIKMNADYNARS